MKRCFPLLALWLAALLPAGAQPRTDVRLDFGWRFLRQDPTNAAQPNFDDSTWAVLSLPHSWGWDQAQLGHPYYRGPGWYRLHLPPVTPEPGRRYFVRFEAASLVSDAYLNGKPLGQHRGGFGAFAYEITKFLSPSGDNLLAVRVDNSSQPDIAPISGDFSVYGGLYRPVHLISTAEQNLTVTDHGSPGVAWLQTDVTATNAVLDVQVHLSNGSTKRKAVAWTAKLVARDGTVVATASESANLSAACTEPHRVRLNVPHPHLWDGRADPYLYHAVVELADGQGNVLDEVDQSIGLRFYHVDPDRGFFLNGHPYHLHGVNRHQDRPVEGWAITEADIQQDIAILKEIGATVVRCCHYQHRDYFYQQCDEAGILVWAEIPQVNEIHDDDAFENTSTSQLRDLIRQNINHPSIFAWSLFNEVGNGKHTQDPHRVLEDLNAIAHGEDPTRPTIAATCRSEMPVMNKIPDLLGWNIYPGWYGGWGKKGDFASSVASRRYDSQHGGLCISEYGAGANILQHEENPKQPNPKGPWHPEEWQAQLHEAAWAQMKDKPYVWGTFVWNLFDFAVSSRNEGSQPGRNDKGLVTYDRQTRKDAFYFYKANWNPEPMVHLTSQRFTDRTNAVIRVKAYSNATTVSLTVNGQTLGDCPNDGNDVFVWKSVPLNLGSNHVVAQAVINGQTVTDQCDWVRH